MGFDEAHLPVPIVEASFDTVGNVFIISAALLISVSPAHRRCIAKRMLVNAHAIKSTTGPSLLALQPLRVFDSTSCARDPINSSSWDSYPDFLEMAILIVEENISILRGYLAQ